MSDKKCKACVKGPKGFKCKYCLLKKEVAEMKKKRRGTSSSSGEEQYGRHRRDSFSDSRDDNFGEGAFGGATDGYEGNYEMPNDYVEPGLNETGETGQEFSPAELAAETTMTPLTVKYCALTKFTGTDFRAHGSVVISMQSKNLSMGFSMNRSDLSLRSNRSKQKILQIVKQIDLTQFTTDVKGPFIITANVPRLEKEGFYGKSLNVNYLVMPGELNSAKPRTIHLLSNRKITNEMMLLQQSFPGLTTDPLSHGAQKLRTTGNRGPVMYSVDANSPLIHNYNSDHADRPDMQLLADIGASRIQVSGRIVEKYSQKLSDKLSSQASYADVAPGLELTISFLEGAVPTGDHFFNFNACVDYFKTDEK